MQQLFDKNAKAVSVRVPWWAAGASYASCGWALLVAIVHFYWASGGNAWLAASPLLQSQQISQAASLWFRAACWGLGGVSLVACLIALALVQSWGRRLPRVPLLLFTWGTCLILLYEANLSTFGGLALDIVAQKPFNGGFLMREVAEVGAFLWLVMALLAQRSLRSACLTCGRTDAPPSQTWLRVATISGYVSCIPAALYGLLKILWSLGIAIGFRNPAQAISQGLVGEFDGSFVLSAIAIVTALALVQPWGERLGRITRWVPMCIAFGTCGLSISVGVMGSEEALAAALGLQALPVHVLPSLGFVYPNFLLWGITLGLALIAYINKTNGYCKRCGRGSRDVAHGGNISPALTQWTAYAACAWALLCAGLFASATLNQSTVFGLILITGIAEGIWAVPVLLALLLCLAGVLVPLAFSQSLRQKCPRWLLLILTWAGAALLALHALNDFLAVGLFTDLERFKRATHMGLVAPATFLGLWFLIGSVLFCAVAWNYRRQSPFSRAKKQHVSNLVG
ncbi:DUF3995 domain-containing protein [Ktedonobacter racemifer]|uniref:Uncharacterized protein n=1 Tax=Ktedonobacter racemifer DSM 44963 TaxID=485913 RepID=D6U5R0_KTERA|nr:DUF3995 domain-containing protein [Ktedonobacter racemifer]EFH80321.1 hypothetical protein Krac_0912 [Ktedonobacter racemifer DSM 44963]